MVWCQREAILTRVALRVGRAPETTTKCLSLMASFMFFLFVLGYRCFYYCEVL